jgi:WD40 repeat protein
MQQSRSLLTTLNSHTSWVLSVTFRPNSVKLEIASSSKDPLIKIWDVASSRLSQEFVDGHMRGVASASYSSDGKFLVLAGNAINYPNDPAVFG